MTPEDEMGFIHRLGRIQFETWVPPMLEDHCHDHPCDFHVFPFTPYVEEVYDKTLGRTWIRKVKAYRWRTYPAEHAHRILGRYSGLDEYSGFDGPQIEEGPVYILVRRGKQRRSWGFWVDNVWFKAEAYYRGNYRLNWVDYN